MSNGTQVVVSAVSPADLASKLKDAAQVVQVPTGALSTIDWASKLKELQHAQRLERLREEQRAVQDKVTQKHQFEQKYEPCVVCGDRASDVSDKAVSFSGLKIFHLWLKVSSPQTEPGEDVKYGSLLANLQERVIQTDQGMVVLSSQMSPCTSANTDLSTLASVVTTLATMGKESEDNPQSAVDALTAAEGGDTGVSETSDSVAKAFDTLAKACQSPPVHQGGDAGETSMTESSMDHSNVSTDSTDASFIVDLEDKVGQEKVKSVMDHIVRLQDYISSINQLHVTPAEFAYLKALVLFSPDNPNLSSKRQVELLQDRMQREFVQMLQTNATSTTDASAAAARAARLSLRLLPLKTFIATTMEELFFAGLIGNVQIDNIIPYILRMETAEYNLHMAGQSLSVPGVAATTPVPATTTQMDSAASVVAQFTSPNLNGGSAQQ
nr:hypothetical protein BaRGS_031988 [Batillaria attramentaria]